MSPRPTLVLVDDDHEHHFLFRRQLSKRLGYPPSRVYSFTDGISALPRIELLMSQARPVVLVLDLNMPLVSGWDLLTDLQRGITAKGLDRRLLTVYVVSGSALQSERERADRHPLVAEYFVKSPTAGDVLTALSGQVAPWSKPDATGHGAASAI